MQNFSEPTGLKPSAFVSSLSALSILQRHVKRGSRVLDLGCGTGSFLRQISDAGYSDFVGVDGYSYDQKSIQLNLSYDKIPMVDGSFDAVTAWEVLEHLENPFHVFFEAQRLLVPGGVFAFSVPNPAHIQSRFEMLLRGSLTRWSRENDHISVLTEEIVLKKIRNIFDVVEVSYSCPMLLPLRGRLIGKINRSLPSNKLFGAFTVYSLRKR